MNTKEYSPEQPQRLFFNSAGSSLMPDAVFDKMLEYLKVERDLGGYDAAKIYQLEIQEFYQQAAKLIGTAPENIAYANNATDAFDKALRSIPFQKGDTILTSGNEYISNQLAFLTLRERRMVNIVYSNHLQNGDLDMEDFEEKVKKHQPKLIALTHIPATSGIVYDAYAVGSICKEYGILYLLDACQTIGQMRVDVAEIGCDFLCATGRKFLRGPRGSGFLYVSDRALRQGFSPVTIHLHGSKMTAPTEHQLLDNIKRYEFWETSYANLLGLKEAIRYANNVGSDTIEAKNLELQQLLRAGLKEIDGIKLLDKGSRQANLITFSTPGIALSSIEESLKEHQIYYSVAHKESSLSDFTEKGADWAIRLSPHYFNTPEEIKELLRLLELILQKLKTKETIAYHAG